MQGIDGTGIRELLREVQATHVRKIGLLGERLESELFSWDNSHLADALQTLHAGGRELHFTELRPGWLQRAFGRHREGFERFAATVAGMDRSATSAREHAVALAGSFATHNDAARRVLMELDMECKDLGARLDDGVTSLQLMCEEINQQRANGGSDRKLATQAEAAQAFTQEFKRLQTISVMVRDIDVRGHAILARRTALLQQVRAEMDHFDKQWSVHVGDLAGGASTASANLTRIAKAIETHDDAMKRLDAALDACGALQGEELFMAEQLEALGAAIQQDPRGAG